MENKLILTERNFLSMGGVKKVNSATETLIDISLENDNMIVSGTDLHINKLDLNNSNIEITGNIVSVKFGKTNKENLFKKVFK